MEEFKGVDQKMKTRIITAGLALLIFVPVVLYGGWPFTILIYFMATIGLVELLRMRDSITSMPKVFSLLLLWFLLSPNMEINLNQISFSKIDILIVYVMVILLYTVVTKNNFTFDDAGFILLASIYVGVGFYFLIVTRSLGINYVLFVLFTIWATDTGAYFIGNAFGHKKLWPEISPKKTIEGALGGVISASIVGIIFHMIIPFEHSLLTIIIITVFISVIGQIGDLVASAFKRHYEIKDSGHIMPGHGGILDRMDSLIFVLPFLYIIQFIS